MRFAEAALDEVAEELVYFVGGGSECTYRRHLTDTLGKFDGARDLLVRLAVDIVVCKFPDEQLGGKK